MHRLIKYRPSSSMAVACIALGVAMTGNAGAIVHDQPNDHDSEGVGPCGPWQRSGTR
jgi:hypothetical protein